MLMDALRWIRQAGIDIHEVGVQYATTEGARVDSVLEVLGGRGPTRFAVEERIRAPYPNELRNLEAHRAALEPLGHALLIVPFVSEPLGVALVHAGWSWADAYGNFDLRGPDLLLRQRHTAKAPAVRKKTLPQGSGSLAIIRALVTFGEREEEEGAATSLAAQARVSQPRASQVLRQLQDLGLVERTGRGRWRPDREALLDRFLAEYSGPRGSEQFLYSLDSPTNAAIAAAKARDARTPSSYRPTSAPILWRHGGGQAWWSCTQNAVSTDAHSALLKHMGTRTRTSSCGARRTSRSSPCQNSSPRWVALTYHSPTLHR